MENNLRSLKIFFILFLFFTSLNIYFFHLNLLNFLDFITYIPFIFLYFSLSSYFQIKKITNINFFNLLFLNFNYILSRKEIFTLDLKRHTKLLDYIIETHYEILISNENYFNSLISKYNEKSLIICDNVFTGKNFIFKYYLPFIDSLSEEQNKAETFFNYMINNLNFNQFSEEELKHIINFKFFSVEKLNILNQALTKKGSFNLLIEKRILFIEMNNF